MPSRFNLLLLFVTAAFFCALAPAHAGHWTVSYTYSATSVGSISPNPNLSGTGPTLPEFYDGFSIGPSSSGSYSHTLTVTATLTWGADSPQEVPPDKVTFVEQGHAWGFGMTHTVPAQNGLVDPKPTADDGLGDANTPTNTDNTRADASSEGGQPTQKPWASTITLPTRTLTFSFTHDAADSDGGSGNSWLSYQVIIVSPSLSGYSTHCAPSLGGSDPNWDPMHPSYFSGTGCQANGKAVAASGNVAHAQLCVGENGSDTVVNEYFDQSASGVPGAVSVPLNAMFDSTHFKDGAKIKITLKVWDTNGGHYEVDITGPAYNKASVLTNHTFGYLFFILEALEVKNTLQGINYSAQSDSFDNRQTILDTMPQYTSFLITSHANDAGFGDCYDNSQGNLISYSEIAAAVAKKTKYQPPYNFAFVDGCHSAGHPNEESTGGPEGFGILPANSSNLYSANDRAFLGWRNFVWSTTNVSWTTEVYQQLAQSHTLYDAVVEATASGEPIGGNEATELVPIYIPAVILGDPSMTLHGVYQNLTSTGSDSHNSDWFRPL